MFGLVACIKPQKCHFSTVSERKSGLCLDCEQKPVNCFDINKKGLRKTSEEETGRQELKN